MESYAPSGSFAFSGHRYRHHHLSHVVQTEPPPPQLSSPIQRGDQEPAGADLSSSEEEQHSYSLESDGDESFLDSFQRPGMINNHINYNQYNTIFRRGGGPSEQRQQSAFVEDGSDLRPPVFERSYSVYRHQLHGGGLDLIFCLVEGQMVVSKGFEAPGCSKVENNDKLYIKINLFFTIL